MAKGRKAAAEPAPGPARKKARPAAKPVIEEPESSEDEELSMDEDEELGLMGTGSEEQDGEGEGGTSGGSEGGEDEDSEDSEDLGIIPDEFDEEEDADGAQPGDGDLFAGGGSDDDVSSEGGSEGDDGLPSSDDAGDGDGDELGLGSSEGLDSEGEGDEEDEEEEEGGSGDEDEDRRRSGAQAGTAAAGEGKGDKAGGFTQGAKGASFAKAFGKLLEGKGSAKAKEGSAVPILAASKSLAKREAAEAEDSAARKEAKKARLERRKRGHVTVPRKGEQPAHDLQEKQLGRLATRGVVLLFNAIAKAQKQTAASGAAGAGAKPAKLSKASFLAQLKGAAGSTGGGGVLAAAGAAVGKAKGGKEVGTEEGAGASGWKVLQAGFSGLGTGGGKMKDWDRKPSGEEDEDAKHMGTGMDAAASDSEEEGW